MKRKLLDSCITSSGALRAASVKGLLLPQSVILSAFMKYPSFIVAVYGNAKEPCDTPLLGENLESK